MKSRSRMVLIHAGFWGYAQLAFYFKWNRSSEGFRWGTDIIPLANVRMGSTETRTETQSQAW